MLAGKELKLADNIFSGHFAWIADQSITNDELLIYRGNSPEDGARPRLHSFLAWFGSPIIFFNYPESRNGKLLRDSVNRIDLIEILANSMQGVHTGATSPPPKYRLNDHFKNRVAAVTLLSKMLVGLPSDADIPPEDRDSHISIAHAGAALTGLHLLEAFAPVFGSTSKERG